MVQRNRVLKKKLGFSSHFALSFDMNQYGICNVRPRIEQVLGYTTAHNLRYIHKCNISGVERTNKNGTNGWESASNLQRHLSLLCALLSLLLVFIS